MTAPVFCWIVVTDGPKLFTMFLLYVMFVTLTVFLIIVTFCSGGKM